MDYVKGIMTDDGLRYYELYQKLPYLIMNFLTYTSCCFEFTSEDHASPYANLVTPVPYAALSYEGVTMLAIKRHSDF